TVGRHFFSSHSKQVAAVFGEERKLLKGALVDEPLDTFTGREFAAGVLSLDALGTATLHEMVAAFAKFSDAIFHGSRSAGIRFRRIHDFDGHCILLRRLLRGTNRYIVRATINGDGVLNWRGPYGARRRSGLRLLFLA